MKKLKIKIQKALNRDVIVCIRQVEHKHAARSLTRINFFLASSYC